MLETQACTNTRYMVQREPRFENDSNVSVLSGDDESAPSETTLDEICESLEGFTHESLHVEIGDQCMFRGGHVQMSRPLCGGQL